MITLDTVCKKYGKTNALTDVSISVSEGERLGLVGANGSGKSTLLGLISGVLLPTTGKVSINGLSPTSAVRNCGVTIGYVPSKDTLVPELSVLDNLRYSALVLGVEDKTAKRRIAELLEVSNVDLPDRKNPRELSTGQRRKLSLLCGIVHTPSLLILDEPTTGIDLPSLSAMYDLIGQMTTSDATIVIATHDASELLSYTANALIMKDGQLISSLPTQSLGNSVDEVRDGIVDVLASCA